MTTQLAWQPQPGPQSVLVNCPVKEIFYGGARGGGKTDGMIGKNAIKASIFGKHQKGIFYRKELPQLEDAIERAHEIYIPLGWKYGEQKKTFTAPNGAILRFRAIEKPKDAEKQQGKGYTDVYAEEVGNYATPREFNLMRGACRSGPGVPTQMHLTGNPDGAGHHWIKARFIGPCPAGMKVLKEKLPNGKIHKRIFIPSKLDDNKILMENDPDYENNLYMAGSEALVRAWRHGDWNVIEGAFFDCWSPKMVHRPFLVPNNWLKVVSFDWGSAAPFSVGWWAIVTDDYKTAEGVLLPRGYALRYREWYGKKVLSDGTQNVGLKMYSEAIGDGIRKRTKEKINNWIADPAAFSQDGGPSHVERMRLPFNRADNARVARVGHIGGWDQMRSRMIGTRTYDDNGVLSEDGWPMIGCFNTCADSIRTIPALQHDENNPEDLNTNMEDHAGDDWRYFCMSRPYAAKLKSASVIHMDSWDRAFARQSRAKSNSYYG